MIFQIPVMWATLNFNHVSLLSSDLTYRAIGDGLVTIRGPVCYFLGEIPKISRISLLQRQLRDIQVHMQKRHFALHTSYAMG